MSTPSSTTPSSPPSWVTSMTAELGRLAGNYPQAFSHLGLIRAADSLATSTTTYR